MRSGVSRRVVLAGALALLAHPSAFAHTPYKQWDVYRRKHLLIGTCRADPESYPLGKKLVAIIADALPESQARVTRARDQRRLASLITTGQLEVVLFRREEALALARGESEFAEFGPFRLELLFATGAHVLVCTPEFPKRHAWLVTRALSEALEPPAAMAAAEPEPLPFHLGAKAYLSGESIPE